MLFLIDMIGTSLFAFPGDTRYGKRGHNSMMNPGYDNGCGGRDYPDMILGTLPPQAFQEVILH